MSTENEVGAHFILTEFDPISAQTLQWRSGAPFALDVTDYEAALTRAERVQRTSESADVREALERAVAPYKGDLLPSCYDDWIIQQREGLAQAYLRALERLVRLLDEQRDYPAAIRCLQQRRVTRIAATARSRATGGESRRR